jgi:glycine/D-amino acid oxidase-like deaminating enzyme
VRIHQQVEVTGIGVEKGKVVSVETTEGMIRTPRVLIATGGYGTQTAGLLGLRPAGEEVFTRRLEYWATGKCNGD